MNVCCLCDAIAFRPPATTRTVLMFDDMAGKEMECTPECRSQYRVVQYSTENPCSIESNLSKSDSSHDLPSLEELHRSPTGDSRELERGLDGAGVDDGLKGYTLAPSNWPADSGHNCQRLQKSTPEVDG